jgi:hypothetical protein
MSQDLERYRRARESIADSADSGSPAASFILIPIRIAIYIGGAWFALAKVEPALGGVFGWLAAVICAALVIALDLVVTSLIRRQTLEQAVSTRMLWIDYFFSNRGESMVEEMQARHQEIEAARQRQAQGELNRGQDFDEDVIDIEVDEN